MTGAQDGEKENSLVLAVTCIVVRGRASARHGVKLELTRRRSAVRGTNRCECSPYSENVCARAFAEASPLQISPSQQVIARCDSQGFGVSVRTQHDFLNRVRDERPRIPNHRNRLLRSTGKAVLWHSLWPRSLIPRSGSANPGYRTTAKVQKAKGDRYQYNLAGEQTPERFVDELRLLGLWRLSSTGP